MYACVRGFSVIQGLKKGCPAACLFFNLFFSVIIFVIHEKLCNKGIELRFRLDGDIFNLKRLKAKSKISKLTLIEILFADDATICATTEEELQTIISTFDETLTEFGLKLAVKKTEIMVQRN